MSGMTSHFLHSIGLSEDTDANFELLKSVDVIGFDQPDGPFNGVARWAVYADPSGATWGYFVTPDGAGHEIYSVRIDHNYTAPAVVTRITDALAEVEIVDGEGDPVTRVLVSVDDPMSYPPAEGNQEGGAMLIKEYGIGAIAESVETWASKSEWEAEQTPMEGPGGQPVYLGPGFIASPWLFALADGSATPNDANPIAMLNGICEAVELVTNQLTGTQFYLTRINCGFPITLAMPAETTPAPKVGCIIGGEAFLVGSAGAWRTQSRAS